MAILAGTMSGVPGVVRLIVAGLRDDEDEEDVPARIKVLQNSVKGRESPVRQFADKGIFSLLGLDMSNSLGIMPVVTGASLQELEVRDLLGPSVGSVELGAAEAMSKAVTLEEGIRAAIGRMSPGMGRAYEGHMGVWGHRLRGQPGARSMRSSTGREQYDRPEQIDFWLSMFGLYPEYAAKIREAGQLRRLIALEKQEFSQRFDMTIERAIKQDDMDLLREAISARERHGLGGVLERYETPSGALVAKKARDLKLSRTERQRILNSLPAEALRNPVWRRLQEEESGGRPRRDLPR